MRFDGMNTMEGRHLVFAYVATIVLQGGYFLYVLRDWLRLGKAAAGEAGSPEKKQRSQHND